MYNRYIPQPDGSYRRRPMTEPVHTQKQPESNRQSPPTPCDPEPQPTPKPSYPPSPRPRPAGNPQRQPQSCRPRQTRKEPVREQSGSVTDFLRQLLPKDFDTGDLLIVLLLLLMSGDCQEDQNSALLTLALYLFL